VLALKRTQRRVGLFLAVSAVVLLLSFLGVALSGYLGAASTAGARAGLAALTGADGGFRITIPLAEGSAAQTAQDRRVRAAVTTEVRTDGRAVPMRVARDVETLGSVELDPDRGAPVHTALASIPGLLSRATLVSGNWPGSSSEASMQVDAARSLQVVVGERLTLPGGAPVTITALWRVRNAADPAWLGDPIPLRGLADDGTAGWVVIDPSLWPQAKTVPAARWIVRPDTLRATAGQLAALAASPDTVSNALSTDPRNGNAVDQDGLLQVAIRPIVQNVQSATAASTAPLVIVAVLGLIMLIELARLLEQLRAGENALLSARGATRARFVVVTVAEAAVAAVLGATLGSALAVGLLAAREASDDIPPLGWIAVGASALVAVVALAAAAGRSTRDVAARSPMRTAGAALVSAGRLRTSVGVGAVVLLALAAVVAVSQFLLYGSPLAPAAGGGLSVDPVAVAAPALAIAAIGVLAVALFPLVARALRRGSRRSNGLRWLPITQLARRSRSAITPVLVLAFAVGGLVVAAGYSGTWATSTAETRAVQVGTSVRVTPTGTLSRSITGRESGQRDAAPVAIDDVQFGQSLVTIVEAPASKLRGVVLPVRGAVDPAALEALLTSRADRPVVPRDATGVLLTFTADPASAAPVSSDLVLVDAAGAESTVTATPVAGGVAGTGGVAGVAVTLPPGQAPWTIHGIGVLMPDLPAGATVAVHLRAVGGSSASIPLDGSWRPVGLPDGPPALAGLDGGGAGLRALVIGGGVHVQLQSVPSGAARLPVVISRGVAAISGLKAGSTTDMTLIAGGGQLPVTVMGVSPAIPGTATGEGVMADLGSVQDAALRSGLRSISAGEWWVSTSSPESAATAAAAMTRRAPPGTRVQTPGSSPADQVLESARVVVWIAGAATALLALLAIVAGLLTELRDRRAEVELLRAIGVVAVVQARNRALEWAGLLGLGLLVGVLDGFVVALLLVPGLARTAVPRAIAALPTTFHVDPLGGGLALIALLLAAGGLLALVSATVRRQARASGAAPELGMDAR
jgi:hypothetical protein